jgi:phosphoribosyl-ATP pyrophosphohydrolase/phosphoribosyl-AMP cyclohydrolase
MNEKGNMTDRNLRDPSDLDALAFWENGLLPVVAQDSESGDVLMVAFANREALEQTLVTGQMHYWSRSRQELWHKGATSGNYQSLVSLHADCDGDTLLARVRPMGPACHTGETTCFGDVSPDLMVPPRGVGPGGGGASTGEGHPVEGSSPPTTGPRASEEVLPRIWSILETRAAQRPKESYTVRLLEDENLRLKKLGEETAELLLALSRQELDRIPQEGADLVYHLLVALLAEGVTLDDLLAELESRMR